ncbi:MAG: peptidylprolyl isomerase [Devosiaceae bacterium]|nr:peptidylprolyl isomerase [Devosiaceae bacterium]
MKLFNTSFLTLPARAFMAAVFLTMLFPISAQAATIKITVNDVPITDTQIAQRAKLLQLERRGDSNAGRNRLAREELIDEVIKLQEATRIGQAPTPAEVAQAYVNVSRNMRVSTDNLTLILNQNGVNSTTLKDRLRAAIAWGKVTASVVSARVQISDVDLEARAAEQTTEADSVDYILKEILFIIPQGSGISNSRRTAQANQYRRAFQGCDTAVELSLKYTDAAVLDLGRRHATQLPDPIATELGRLSVGGITAPRVVANGVSMLAVCSKTVARDLSFATNELRQEAGNELLEAEADKYLAELRDKANIINL